MGRGWRDLTSYNSYLIDKYMASIYRLRFLIDPICISLQLFLMWISYPLTALEIRNQIPINISTCEMNPTHPSSCWFSYSLLRSVSCIHSIPLFSPSSYWFLYFSYSYSEVSHSFIHSFNHPIPLFSSLLFYPVLATTAWYYGIPIPISIPIPIPIFNPSPIHPSIHPSLGAAINTGKSIIKSSHLQ